MAPGDTKKRARLIASRGWAPPCSPPTEQGVSSMPRADKAKLVANITVVAGATTAPRRRATMKKPVPVTTTPFLSIKPQNTCFVTPSAPPPYPFCDKKIKNDKNHQSWCQGLASATTISMKKKKITTAAIEAVFLDTADVVAIDMMKAAAAASEEEEEDR